MSDNILEMRHIVKTFPGVRALSDVSFAVRRGEIHCLVGENGAGKSTLMKVLSGVYPHNDFEGEILLNGKNIEFNGIHDSELAGIGTIYQELALVPEMTVYENIMLGHELRRGMGIDIQEMIQRAEDLLKRVRLSVNPSAKVKDLGIGKQQLVEIAKALSRNVSLLILDEPTAALNEDDCDNLLDILRILKTQGVTSIMISHKLKEVLSIAETITVLRDGQTICTLDREKDKVDEQMLIKHMVGRSIENIYPPRASKPDESVVLLEVKNWSAYDPNLGRKVLNNVNFKVHKGEVVGLSGLVGSGRTELARSMFGNPDGYAIAGELSFKGRKQRFAHPSSAIRAGLAYATEDRKKNGLVLIKSIQENISLANLQGVSKHGIINEELDKQTALNFVNSLSIKTPGINQLCMNLSGGNQQKVSVAKWLFVGPDLLIFDEPTRGIDVGAKYEIYTIINDLVAKGMSILMISSELPEILGMSDRIYVVANGTIAGELDGKSATQEAVMRLATQY